MPTIKNDSQSLLGLVFIAAGVFKIVTLYEIIKFTVPYNILDWVLAVGAVIGGLKLIIRYRIKLE